MSNEQVPAPRRLRVAGFVALLFIIALFVPTLLQLTSDATYPKLAPPRPALAPLTRRVVLVVVDGLRYDYAVDPKLAPNFSRNMREHSSAAVWAGRITMTSAAVLSFSTGTRGTFSQVVLNVDARRTTANHLFENAQAAGLRAGVVGDPVWKAAIGGFDFEHLSDGHLALDVDDTPELFAGAHALLASGEQPQLLILHFFANDHLQHVHGVFSKTFREFFLRFDQNLQKYLNALPPDTTVLALSDHGALANGNHGVDSDLERKTPLFAYGPGIRPGQKLELDQVDVAATLAALLGVSSPANGVGTPMTPLLDIDVDADARLTCAEAERVTTHAKAAGGETAERDPALTACRDGAGTAAERAEGARGVVRYWDRELAAMAARKGARGLVWSFAILLAFGALAPFVLGLRSRSQSLRGALALGGVALTSVALTTVVDRTLPPFNDARAAMIWLSTLLLAALLIFPRLAERAYGRLPFLTLAFAPGFLFASFPTNTQLHAGLVAAACWIAAVVAARRSDRKASTLLFPLFMGALGTATLLRLATVREDPLEALVIGREGWFGLAAVSVWLLGAAFVVPRSTRGGRRALELAVGLPVALVSTLPQGWLPAPLGLSLLLVLPLLALWAWRNGSPLLGRALLFAGYGLVSRPIEIPAVVAAVLVAEVVGSCLRRPTERTPAVGHLGWAVVLTAATSFALAFAVRVGLQRGLDFGAMDWGAGTFDSTAVPHTRIVLALVVKYGTSLGLPAVVLFTWLPSAVWRPALRLLLAALVLRYATMAAILFAPPVSFWSRFRMVGELGPVLVMAFLAACALIAVEPSARRTREAALADGERLAAS